MLTDFLQNTYIPVDEMTQIIKTDTRYSLSEKTIFMSRNFKKTHAVAQMQQQQASQEHNLDPKNLPKRKKPLYDFSESGYQIQMVLYPIHVIMMTIKQSKQMCDVPSSSNPNVKDL